MTYRSCAAWCAAASSAALLWSMHPAARQVTLQERIARIENRLLPGIVITGGPPESMTIADRMRQYHIPGVSVAVINGGIVEWTRGYGVLEAGGAQPVTPRTRFQAASISKPVTALAALVLVQAGRLALDENVNAKLTSWKVPDNDLTRTEKVTLRRILSHGAGLTVHGFPGYASTAPLPTLLQVLDGVKPANTEPIRVDILPGSQFRYSGGGYTVLQQMLIDVSGRPFPSFMRETVLQPTRMDGSTFEQPLPVALRAEAATAHDASGKPVPGRYHTYPEMAAAGLWTTPGDLARFAIEIQQALAGRSKVLSAATAREMLTTQMVPYGLGVTLGGTGRAERFSHGGSNEGFECQMVAFAELGQGAVVMTNGQGGGRLAAELLRAIAHEYAWPDYGRVREKTVARIDPAIYQSYAGRYEMGPDHIVILKIVAGKLILVDGKQTIELLPESETKFFELVEESEIEFIKGPDGTVTGAVINGRTKARRLGPGGRP